MNPPAPLSDHASLLKEDESYYRSRMAGRETTARHNVIDLFCGAGGMSLGFSELAGQPFRSVWANDFNTYCADTYNLNFNPLCRHGDIVSLLEDKTLEIPEADVVIGGPPCQGFSLLNKHRREDTRKQLWRPFLEVVRRSKASVFVMENVPQLLGTLEHQEIVNLAESMGFKLRHCVLTAADYGVPQTRNRAFIMGCNFADPAPLFPPRKTHFNPNARKSKNQPLGVHPDETHYLPNPQPWRTVRDAVGLLPPPVGADIRKTPPPLDLHFGRNPTELSRKRYRAIPDEGMNRFDLQRIAPELTPDCWLRKKTGGTDLFGRLWWDRPSITIRTEFFKPEKGRYLHPQQHRPITFREAARFQGFPDEFRFTGSKTEIARQIGNAVPPPLAARVADVVRLMLDHRHSFFVGS